MIGVVLVVAVTLVAQKRVQASKHQGQTPPPLARGDALALETNPMPEDPPGVDAEAPSIA